MDDLLVTMFGQKSYISFPAISLDEEATVSQLVNKFIFLSSSTHNCSNALITSLTAAFTLVCNAAFQSISSI